MPEIQDSEIDNLEFTMCAKRNVKALVRDPYFQDEDEDKIYGFLQEAMRVVSFSDYLKRYVYRKAEMTGDYQEISDKVYQEEIIRNFNNRNTPCSFEPNTMRLKSAVKNWLKQDYVNRNVVLLMGFGLGMTEAEVNEFLTKALHEHKLNAKDPFEAVCYYCYRNGYSYSVFQEFWASFSNRLRNHESSNSDTLHYIQALSEVRTPEQLKTYLSELPVIPGAICQSVTGRCYFNDLYERTQKLVADIMTNSSRDSAETEAENLRSKLDHSSRFSDAQKREKIQKQYDSYIRYKAEEIGPADIERVLYSGLEKDKNGNLLSMKGSQLKIKFAGKRLTRQHLGEILNGTAPITRYDLMTLNFFVYSQKEFPKRKERYQDFVRTTNEMLDRCGFGKLYVTSNYECFLLVSMITEEPLSTYAAVWEKSFATAN